MTPFWAHSQNCKKRLLGSSRVPYVRPSVCPHVTNLRPLDEDFHEILYLRISQKSVEEIQVPLKSENNNGYFA